MKIGLPEKDIRRVIQDLWYGEKIIRFCFQPRATSEIREAFEKWKVGDSSSIFSSSFSDHMKKLENAGTIEYTDGKWQTKKETKDLVRKYFG